LCSSQVEDWDIPWGDKMTAVEPDNKNFLRIIFWNCGGFPNDRLNPKNHLIRNTLQETRADIAALAETNISWKMLRPQDRLHERTWGWFPFTHISYSYPVDFPASSANLTGGTAVFTLNNMVHQVADKSSDSLGRWTSTVVRGKRNHLVRVISAYHRCVKNTHGPLSVWNQQRYLLDLQRCELDPLDKFDSDLKVFLEECTAAGELIVLGIDINEDVRTGSFNKKMNALGLTEACTYRHGHQAPPTYARGSVPIDALYVSPSLLGNKCGYLKVVSDHRVLWLDLPYNITFGHKLSNLPIRQPQRLILQDPRVVGKYVTILESYMKEIRFQEKISALQQTFQAQGSSSYAIQQYDELDDLRLTGVLCANQRCRHIRMGQVPFSPGMVTAWNRIKAWQLLRRKLLGG
jgi:hypothetical protein